MHGKKQKPMTLKEAIDIVDHREGYTLEVKHTTFSPTTIVLELKTPGIRFKKEIIVTPEEYARYTAWHHTRQILKDTGNAETP